MACIATVPPSPRLASAMSRAWSESRRSVPVVSEIIGIGLVKGRGATAQAPVGEVLPSEEADIGGSGRQSLGGRFELGRGCGDHESFDFDR